MGQRREGELVDGSRERAVAHRHCVALRVELPPDYVRPFRQEILTYIWSTFCYRL